MLDSHTERRLPKKREIKEKLTLRDISASRPCLFFNNLTSSAFWLAIWSIWNERLDLLLLENRGTPVVQELYMPLSALLLSSRPSAPTLLAMTSAWLYFEFWYSITSRWGSVPGQLAWRGIFYSFFFFFFYETHKLDPRYLCLSLSLSLSRGKGCNHVTDG